MEENTLKNDSVILQQDGILNDVKRIIKQAAEASQKAIDIVLLRRNWLIGKRIYEEELKECRSENYGLEIIKQLSVDLTKSYGKGYSKSNLYTFYKFYKLYSEIFNENKDIPRLLSRSHYQLLIGVDDLAARAWYEEETLNNYWSVRRRFINRSL